jgi:hypothetical protein
LARHSRQLRVALADFGGNFELARQPKPIFVFSHGKNRADKGRVDGELLINYRQSDSEELSGHGDYFLSLEAA